MPGLFGFYAFGEGRENWDAERFIYYGLMALQGRGEEESSLAAFTNESPAFNTRSVKGPPDKLFTTNVQGEQPGFLGIGQVSPVQGDAIISVEGPVRLVLVGDGMPNLDADKVQAFRRLGQILSEKLESNPDALEGAAKTVHEVRGGYAFLALTERQELICGRDCLGVKPLEVGAIGFDLGIVASESAALEVVGATHSGHVRSGEVVVFDPLSIRRKVVGENRSAHCAFEYIYLARPDSVMNNLPVARVRDGVGRVLARESPAIGDVVIGVPETAIPFAMAFSRENGAPVTQGFVRTGRHVRSAIKPTQLERLTGVQLKLNPVRSAVDGKNVILIDDSVVRGNTLRNTVLSLKRKGAKSIHVRVGSPALVARCPFGVEVPPEDELIGSQLSREQIADVIGADTFSYLSVTGLIEAVGLPRERLCLGCFTGTYPKEECEA